MKRKHLAGLIAGLAIIVITANTAMAQTTAASRPRFSHQTIYVVDLQDGGNWDWTQGEPPKDNPAYYLRFCKSFARMGGHSVSSSAV